MEVQNDSAELRRANELASTVYAEQFAEVLPEKFLGIDFDEERPRSFVGDSIMEVLNRARRMDRIVIVAVREARNPDWWLVRMEPRAFELLDRFNDGSAKAFLYVIKGEVPLRPAFFRKLDRGSAITLFASRGAAAKVSKDLQESAELVQVSNKELQHLAPYVLEMVT